MTVCTDVEILELGKFFIYVTDKSIMIMIQGVPIYTWEFSDEFDIVFQNKSLLQYSDTY